MRQKPLVVQNVVVFELVPDIFLFVSVVDNKVFPLLVSGTLKMLVGERIMNVMIAKQMNTVGFADGVLQPISHFTNAVRVVTEIIKKISQEDYFVMFDGVNNLLCLLPPQMQVGYNKSLLHPLTIPDPGEMSNVFLRFYDVSVQEQAPFDYPNVGWVGSVLANEIAANAFLDVLFPVDRSTPLTNNGKW